MHGSQWSRKSAPGVSMTTTNIKRIPGLVLWFSQLYPDWSHLFKVLQGGTWANLTCFTLQRTHAHTCSHPHTRAHTHTQQNSQSELVHDRHLFSPTSYNRNRGDVHQGQASNREPREDLSPSTWHALISFDRVKQLVQHSVCPRRIDFKSQWICDSRLTFSMYPLKLSELIKQSGFFQFDLMIKSNQINSQSPSSTRVQKKKKKSYPVQVVFLPVTINRFLLYAFN